MSSLNNLYISQSYQGLLHFGSNTASVAQLGIIEDGLGNSLGLYLNNNGDLRTTTSISSSTIEATNLKIKNKIEITGSIDIDGPVTASSAFIESDLIVSGTLFAKEVHTLIESSSIIFSTGSNILGDSTADIQTLNGKVIVSGSEEITGSLQVSNNISSSTISGIGNVTAYSQSVSSSILALSQSVSSSQHEQDITSSYLIGPFSSSVDQRLDSLENATASLGYVTTGSFFTYTASVDAKFIAIGASTSSLNIYTQSQDTKNSTLANYTASIDTKFSTLSSYTSSINSYTQSNDTKWSTLQSYTSSVDSKFNTLASTTASLISKTGSYATTGSNTFIGNEIFSGSVRGNVLALSISSNTASMDISQANFFTLTLVSGSNTHISASGINPGETISLRITQPSVGFGTITTSPNIRFPQAFPYIATPSGSAVDILSFQTYDTTFLYGVAVNTMR